MNPFTYRCRVAAEKAVAKGIPNDPDVRLRELLPWLKPVHISLLDPNQFGGMTPIVASGLTLTHVPGAGDFSVDALRLSSAGAVTDAQIHLQLPILAEQLDHTPTVVDNPLRRKYAAGATHLRVKCSNWQAVTKLFVSLTDGPSGADRHEARLVVDGKSAYGCTNPIYADAWNGKYRTLPHSSGDHYVVGSPQPWGDQSRYYTPYGVMIEATTTAAVTLDIDRLYSPDWPAAAITQIWDGWNRSALDWTISEYIPRGWGASGSLSSQLQFWRRPIIAELEHLARAGCDTFVHGKWRKPDGSVAGMEATSPASEFLPYFIQMRAILARTGHQSNFTQWLRNQGVYDGVDMGGLLRRCGVTAGRRSASDAEWGVNPWDTAYDNYRWGSRAPWVNYGGRYNHFTIGDETNIAVHADYDAPKLQPTGYTMMERITYAALSGNALMHHDHQSYDLSGVFETDQYTTSVQYRKAQLAHLAELEKAGKVVMTSVRDLLGLTYDRPGDVFLRWDGEWVYRHDPTRIAF
jgi:hypothetical protein